MIFHASHNKCSHGGAILHIVKVGIDANNGAVIFYIVILVIRVGMFCFRRSHLVGHSCHAPRRTVVVIVVCIDVHVAAGNICRGDIIDDLLVVSGLCHLDFLSNARCEGRC